MFWRNSPRLLISSQPNFKSKTGNSKWFNTSFMFIKQTIVSLSKNIWMWEVKKFNLKETSHAVSNSNLFISRLNIKSDYVFLWSQATVLKTPNSIMQHPTRIKKNPVIPPRISGFWAHHYRTSRAFDLTNFKVRFFLLQGKTENKNLSSLGMFWTPGDGYSKCKGLNINFHSKNTILYLSHLRKTKIKQKKKKKAKKKTQHIFNWARSQIWRNESTENLRSVLEKEPKYTSWRIKTKWRAH